MADHGADAAAQSSSEERKKQMLKAKIVKSAKKKIEETEKVREGLPMYSSSWMALGQPCICSNGDSGTFSSSRPRSCAGVGACARVSGAPGPSAAARFCASRHTRSHLSGVTGDGRGAAAECQLVAGEMCSATPIETGAWRVRAR
jgi:hypothetical protein